MAVLCLALFVALPGSALGQAEGPQRYFNVKAGPVFITLSSGVSTEFTDNINLSNGTTTPKRSEMSIFPNIGINAATQLQFVPMSETNTSDLRFRANFGYREYVFHSQLNQKVMDINLSPDSELSFLIHAGHFKIRLHDGFSMQSDPSTDGSLSNIAQFRRIVNSAGADTLWDVNSRTRVNLGYTHTNLYALSITTLGNSRGGANALNASRLNNSTDTASLTANCQVLAAINIGFTTSVQATSFPSAPDQDSTNISYGPTASLRLSQYTTLTASTGVSKVKGGNVFDPTTRRSSAFGVDGSANYYDLTLANQLNRFYTHSLSVGSQVSLTLLGSQSKVSYLRYASTWRVNSHISIATGLFAEDTSNVGLIGGSYRYRRYGCTLNTSYQLSKRMYTSLGYRYIDKVSDLPSQSYKQNTITWAVNYQF